MRFDSADIEDFFDYALNFYSDRIALQKIWNDDGSRKETKKMTFDEFMASELKVTVLVI